MSCMSFDPIKSSTFAACDKGTDTSMSSVSFSSAAIILEPPEGMTEDSLFLLLGNPKDPALLDGKRVARAHPAARSARFVIADLFVR